jgi:microcompartment protein CcmL/EutN
VADINSIGLIETSSVATGYVVENAMLKAASVELLLGRSICSGKFLIAIAGDVASTTAALDAGAAVANGSLIEKKLIARLHPAVLPAISMAAVIDATTIRSLGLIETFSAASIVEAADAALKSANVELLRLHLAMALGGKGFALLAGDVSSVEAAVAIGSQIAADEGMLVSRGVIAAPEKELFQEFI